MLHAFSAGDMTAKEALDIKAWERHRDRQGDSQSAFLDHKLEKIAAARKFVRHFDRYGKIFANAGVVLEIGGGSCWASYLVKLRYSSATVIGSDIAPAAVESHSIWESIFGARIDRTFACSSYEIPMEDASIDLVFCFEAAHHFGRHGRTMRELARIIRPNGYALYLDEPTCPPWLYSLAHRRSNKRLDEVPEDTLLHRQIVALADAAGFDAMVDFDPHTVERGEIQTLYYMVLRRLRPLAGVLPCTANFVMQRRPLAVGSVPSAVGGTPS